MSLWETRSQYVSLRNVAEMMEFQPSRHPGWPAQLGPVIVAAGSVRLRPVKLSDAMVWSRMRIRDRDYLRIWEPDGPGDWAERNAPLTWPAQFLLWRRLARRGQALPFVITVDHEYAGQITVGNVIRGGLNSGWIGYWVGSNLAGGGVATAAVALLADHCFGVVGLHRLEATARPENVASLRVLRKNSFRDEGFFRRYLAVDGDWRDHVYLALTAEEVPEGLVTRLAVTGRVRID